MSIYVCQNCNIELPYVAFIRSSFCEKPNCQRAKAQHDIVAAKEQMLSEVTSEVTQACNDYFLNTQSSMADLDKKSTLIKSHQLKAANIAILPINTRTLVSLSKKQKNEFLLHLETLYLDIIEQRPPSTKIYEHELNEPLESAEQQLLGKACATCLGECCSLGKNHAFQDITSLSHFLANQPKMLTLDELTRLYSQFFPRKHYKSACIFQGNKGCTLPVELRSFTCKNYRCPSLRSYHQELLTTNQKLTIAVGSIERAIKKVSIFDETTFIRIK